MTEATANILIPSVNCRLTGDAFAPQPMSEVMTAVMTAINDERVAWQLQRFAPNFKRHSIQQQYEALRELHQFVRYQIPYKEDPSNRQLVKDPACCWQHRQLGADCKSKTVFIHWTLRLIGLPSLINFLVYNNVQGHVFPSTVLGGQLVNVDAVDNRFDHHGNDGVQYEKIIKYPNNFQQLLRY